MAVQQYRASLSKGRESWCLIFRHPARLTADGKPGLRVRRGLGTSDPIEAQRLVDQMNDILARRELWTPAAREATARSFDPRVVAAFYHNLDPTEYNPWALRDSVIPLPGQEQGYVRVMFAGTTGAGKTTVIRQLIGTDPLRERFPSTSAAKTTVSDTEIVMDTAPEFRAVVTFLQKEAVQLYIEECVTATVLASIDTRPLHNLTKQLLEHKEQRFRLSYLLGTLQATSSPKKEVAEEEDPFTEEEEEETGNTEASNSEEPEVSPEERARLQEKLRNYLERITELATVEKESIETMLGIRFSTATREERETMEELLEDNLRNNDAFLEIADNIMDDIESRFDLLQEGIVERGPGGWPSHWTYSCTAQQKAEFIRIVNRFSSNYAPNYGRLLTPIVEGVRVSGPFFPKWAGDRVTRLVLLDGEGLGHTPDSTMSLSSKTTRRFDYADAVVLVDDAAQPLQASPIMLLRSIASRGQEDKLVVAFTHFEDVKGDNLPTPAARRSHVLSSLDNAIRSVGEVLGRSSENALRRVTETNVVFLAGIDKPIPLETDDKIQRLSRNQLLALLDMLDRKILPPEPGTIAPVYDDANIVLKIQRATKALNEEWQAKVGLRPHPDFKKVPWARTKALTRRLAELGVDEYAGLRPVADMARYLNEHLSRFLSEPIGWEPPAQQIDDEQMRAAVNRITSPLARRLDQLAHDRMWIEHLADWRTAYSRSGRGSTFDRANDIVALFNQAAPVPGEVESLEATNFTRLVRQILREAITENGGKLRQE